MPEIEQKGFHIEHHKAQPDVLPHDHPFLELSYFVSGMAEHTLDGKTDVLNAGDYLLVDYGSRHSYHALSGDTFENIDCLFVPSLIDPSLPKTAGIADVLMHYLLNFNMQALKENPARIIFHDSNGTVRHLIECILEENKQKRAGYTELIRCYLIEILILTVRTMEGAEISEHDNGICGVITSYVKDHYAEDVSLAFLSEQMNYSLPYISRIFKEQMGMTYISYLQKYRITQACRKLTSTELSVNAVAEAVGYTDVKYFAALFCRITGISPSKFRKRFKTK